MKILIQNRVTKEFYLGRGDWTSKKENAKVFPTSAQAMQECIKQKLAADILLAFPDPKFDITVSTSHGNGP